MKIVLGYYPDHYHNSPLLSLLLDEIIEEFPQELRVREYIGAHLLHRGGSRIT